ncbi:hypothetical protein [Parachitinimonas caeni]|uniref:Lipoprotein n=1 Tax=Parachitinimonas caeni TaxID=3031301 RepID=A0ABT7DU85_9NEIS|nr:hypothetical protein [Parachitinimonas caeni]MDK2123596.1 hypothetical protein [Parachitinimonas caeni]
MIKHLVWIGLLLGLTGCERLNDIANQAKANGKAVGAACRHSGRALEDCYRRNPRIAKADIYAGWKEMNEYMLTKKIEVVPPPEDPEPIKKAKKSVPTVEIGGGETAGADKPSGEPDKAKAHGAAE